MLHNIFLSFKNILYKIKMKLPKRKDKHLIHKIRKEDEPHIFYTVFLIILLLWLTLALGAVNLDEKEVNLLHKYPFMRILLVFLTTYFVLIHAVVEDAYKRYDRKERLFIAFIPTILYTFLVERKNIWQIDT